MAYEIDDDPARVDRDAVWTWLSTEAYWGRWRSRADIDAQLAGAWRQVAAYDDATGELVGYARAVSDGVAFAYLADVFVTAPHRGKGVARDILRLMIDNGPGAHFRWVLFTEDAHPLYRRFGFAEPDATTMTRPMQR